MCVKRMKSKKEKNECVRMFFFFFVYHILALQRITTNFNGFNKLNHLLKRVDTKLNPQHTQKSMHDIFAYKKKKGKKNFGFNFLLFSPFCVLLFLRGSQMTRRLIYEFICN